MLCEPGSELRVGGKEKRKGEDNKWDERGKKKVRRTSQHVSPLEGTSWFKHKTPNFVSHEHRMHWQLERHTFCIMLTAMNNGRG